VTGLLRAWLEKAKEAGGDAASADTAVSAHLIDCGRLFTRSWASVEFLHRAEYGTGKVQHHLLRWPKFTCSWGSVTLTCHHHTHTCIAVQVKVGVPQGLPTLTFQVLSKATPSTKGTRATTTHANDSHRLSQSFRV
jgi:hypothetical protein